MFAMIRDSQAVGRGCELIWWSSSVAHPEIYRLNPELGKVLTLQPPPSLFLPYIALVMEGEKGLLYVRGLQLNIMAKPVSRRECRPSSSAMRYCGVG